MKLIKIIIVTVLFLCNSCHSIQDKIQLENEYNELLAQKHKIENTISNLNKDLKELHYERKALYNNREPIYIVKFQIKQLTYTLDIGEHIKNEINTISIEIPVCKEYYDQLNINQEITSKFKWGSLVMNGDFSKLRIRVVNKRIE